MLIKKALPLFVLLVLLVSGCSRSGEEINILEGPGSANSSRLIGFSRLCAGTAEAFVNGASMLVSEETGDGWNLFSADLISGSTTRLLSLSPESGHTVELSADGKMLLCGGTLYNLQSGSQQSLPGAAYAGSTVPDGVSALTPFSFAGGNELLFTDPYYYIRKYSLPGQKTTARLTTIALIKLGDKSSPAPFNGFSGLIMPQLDYIKAPRLLPDDLKYVFIGIRPDSKETPLYMLDLFEKKFTLLDENVRSFTLAPDGRSLAYIAVNEGQDDRLMASDTSGSFRKELLSLEYLSEIEWSPKGGWIAWSGGRENRCDAGIIKADGTSNEQLTNAMYTGPRLAWSAAGDKLAFTSMAAGKNPETYVATLAGTDQPESYGNKYSDPAKEVMSAQLMNLLRKETALAFKSK